MRKTTKILSVVLATVAASTAFASCGREVINDLSGDSSKTNILVSNYEGGFGRAWLDKAAERFEALYADEVFEEGKKGVDIIIDSNINDKAGSTFISGLKNSTAHVIFTEDAPYYDIVSGGYAADITDVVTGSLSTFGEEGTIEGKLDTAVSNYFKTSENKYFALPHYEAHNGIVFDVDLFDKKGLWLNANGGFGGRNATLSNGPDGTPNTYDDGLPATYDDFFKLCDLMLQKGITPFTWAGGVQVLSTHALVNLWADYEGKDNYYLNFSHSGTATSLVNSMTGDGTMNAQGRYDDMMAATEITEANANLLQRQAGKYVALNFMKRLISNSSYYTDLSFAPSESNLTAQGTYLLSRLESSKKPIAFLMDGVWWENEADTNGKFREYEVYGETKMTRKFGWMPFPKATATQVGENRTMATNCNNSLSFVNGNITDAVILRVSKLFLQFVHTENELQEFSVNTGTLKPLNYTIPQTKMENMTYFGKYILELRNNPKVDVVYTFARTEDYINNAAKYHPDEAFANGTYAKNPAEVFKNNPSVTVKTYFDLFTK